MFGLLSLGLLGLVAELAGRSLTHRIDVGRQVGRVSYAHADYYPFLLAGVKIGVALMLARIAWRFAKARAAGRAAHRGRRRARRAAEAARAARPHRAVASPLAHLVRRHGVDLPRAGGRRGRGRRPLDAAVLAVAAQLGAARLRRPRRRRRGRLPRRRRAGSPTTRASPRRPSPTHAVSPRPGFRPRRCSAAPTRGRPARASVSRSNPARRRSRPRSRAPARDGRASEAGGGTDVSADIAHELKRHDGDELEQTRSRTLRARIVLALGPAAMVGGIVWAVMQPWRLTLLHPHGQGFWWLVSEPPLYVILVGLVFRLVIAPGVAADLERTSGDRRDHAAGRDGALVVRHRLPHARPGAPRRGARRAGGLAAPAVAGLSLAEPRLRHGRPHVAGDGLLHQLGDPHGRARFVGRGADARGRGGARGRAREAPLASTGG